MCLVRYNDGYDRPRTSAFLTASSRYEEYIKDRISTQTVCIITSISSIFKPKNSLHIINMQFSLATMALVLASQALASPAELPRSNQVADGFITVESPIHTEAPGPCNSNEQGMMLLPNSRNIGWLSHQFSNA